MTSLFLLGHFTKNSDEKTNPKSWQVTSDVTKVFKKLKIFNYFSINENLVIIELIMENFNDFYAKWCIGNLLNIIISFILHQLSITI